MAAGFAAVPAATVTAPVAGFSVRPAVPLTKEMTTFAVVAAAPFSVSFVSTVARARPPVAPLIEAPASFTASMTAARIGTVTVAVSQLPGFSTSQIR